MASASTPRRHHRWGGANLRHSSIARAISLGPGACSRTVPSATAFPSHNRSHGARHRGPQMRPIRLAWEFIAVLSPPSSASAASPASMPVTSALKSPCDDRGRARSRSRQRSASRPRLRSRQRCSRRITPALTHPSGQRFRSRPQGRERAAPPRPALCAGCRGERADRCRHERRRSAIRPAARLCTPTVRGRLGIGRGVGGAALPHALMGTGESVHHHPALAERAQQTRAPAAGVNDLKRLKDFTARKRHRPALCGARHCVDGCRRDQRRAADNGVGAKIRLEACAVEPPADAVGIAEGVERHRFVRAPAADLERRRGMPCRREALPGADPRKHAPCSAGKRFADPPTGLSDPIDQRNGYRRGQRRRGGGARGPRPDDHDVESHRCGGSPRGKRLTRSMPERSTSVAERTPRRCVAAGSAWRGAVPVSAAFST